MAHHKSWMNSGTDLELTVISWQSAWFVCPREHCLIHTHAHTHHTVLSTCALRILLTFALSTVCTSAELECSPISFSVYSVVCPKHTPNQHFKSLSFSLPHPLSVSCSLSLPPFLSLSPLLPVHVCCSQLPKTVG